MQGLATLLPEPFFAQVQSLWDELETAHNLRGVRVTPFPHFTWQIAAGYDPARIKPAVEAFARRTPRFLVRTTGLGLFSGPRPVLYIPIVKTAMLLRAHADLWESARPAASQFSPYYSPGGWMPHITLAIDDLDVANIGPVLQTLAFRDFSWEMTVDSLTFLDQPGGINTFIQWELPLANTL